MKLILLLSFLPLALAACSQKPTPQFESDGDRRPAATLEQESSKLIYVTYKKNGEANVEEITPERWKGINGGFSAGGRLKYLEMIYYANTRNVSLKGHEHAACFYGYAGRLKSEFFVEGDPHSALGKTKNAWAKAAASEDGRMLGIRFELPGKGSVHFRLAHCDSGKSTFSPKTAGNKRAPSSQSFPTAKQAREIAQAVTAQYGFTMLDKASDRSLPQFKLQADYEKAFQAPVERPWQGLNLRDQKEALRFALIAQKYFYENMANQNPAKPDFNFIPSQNKSRYWCHMPWMNVGHVGREAIHGLTQERDLVPSKKIAIYQNATPGTNWGVAYFNAPGCQTLNKVFGSESAPKEKPDFEQGQFENGTFIAKMLFTTADPVSFPTIQNAYSWKANATEVGSTERKIRTVRHIQMDIAVKDSSLKGVNPVLANWAMIGFYYDPTYDYDKEYKDLLGEENPLKSIANLPPELLKMRPIGVQSGFEAPATGETIVFPGSFANGSGGRLNGPADNPKSSCMGCHGAAGTKAAMIPGFLSMKMFEPHKGTTMLDFNQQLALAKANYETEIAK